MGGGVSKKNRNKGNKAVEDRTPFLLPNDIWNGQSITRQSRDSTQADYVSDIFLASYPEKTSQDERTQNIFALFVAMCYLLIEKFKETKNKKMFNFINKIEEMITINNDGLFNSSEFKKFQNFFRNKSIHRYHGYEVVRNFLTKYFSDSSSVFIKLRKDEWEQYVNRFLIRKIRRIL